MINAVYILMVFWANATSLQPEAVFHNFLDCQAQAERINRASGHYIASCLRSTIQ